MRRGFLTPSQDAAAASNASNASDSDIPAGLPHDDSDEDEVSGPFCTNKLYILPVPYVYFQFLRTERRIEEIETEFLVYDAQDNPTVRFGPAPSLLGTRRYNYNPDSQWDGDADAYSTRDTYPNVSAWELYSAA